MKFRVVVALTAIALTLTACGSKDAKKADPKANERDSATLVERSPLTGLALKNGLPNNPVFVVKVENTDNGAPQYGLNKADLVFEELVEGGLTRLAALYYSNIPSKIGHVRSMRATDIGIAGPVNGQIVASGGANGTYKRVQSAGIKVFSEDRGAPGFSSDPSKVRPYNRLINLQTLAKKAKTTSIRGNYLPWLTTPAKATPTPSAGATTAPASKTATKLDVGFSNSTHTRWALNGDTWQRTNGHAASGQDFKADTLLILYAKVGNAGYLDPAGNTVPETIFEGSGKAMVLHGKTVTAATWTKKSLKQQITLVGTDGKPIGINPGHVWIELVPKDGGSVKIG